MSRSDYAPLDLAELAAQLPAPAEGEPGLAAALAELERTGRIARVKGDRFLPSREADLIPGRIRMNRQGKGFLQPDDPGVPEIAIPESATGTALHEDRVLVRQDVAPKGLRREGPSKPPAQATGTVVRILERRRTRMVGTLQRSQQFYYVIPDDPRIPHDIYVAPPRDVGRIPRPGDKVLVEMREWLSRHTNPEGEIIELLGAPDAEGVDMLSVLRQYELPLHFEQAVLDEARAYGSAIADAELADRVDCRTHPVVTIDPDDAKDFDDAICLERDGTDRWRLWVHIADVSHYVKVGSPLDTEARKRGNSTYLVDRVIPMLPEALSNELCSLKPEVDRLTKCVEFLLDDDGTVRSTKLYSAVIHSKRRFTYGEAFAVLQRPPADPIEEMLHHAHGLAQKIRHARFKNGSLELDFPEMKIRLDDEGRIARIEKIENDASHQLIEEYMLLANEAVAGQLMKRKQPAVYRVHEEPDARRLAEYREDVLSHNVSCGNLRQRPEVQRLLQRLVKLPIGQALRIGFLKSLMRARYAVQPLGHYGLAKKEYTHFTSPIRRYADLLVHRAAFDPIPTSLAALQQVADHISVTERNSADAERDSKDVKLFAHLNRQLESGKPEAYPALVTDVRNFGFFVDVPGLAMSGLVPVSGLADDFYVFDPDRSNLVGRRTRRVISLGDPVTVQVAKVDSFKKQVDFTLVSTAPVRTAPSDRPPIASRITPRPAAGAERPAPRPGMRPTRPGAGTGFREDRGRSGPPRPTFRSGPSVRPERLPAGPASNRPFPAARPSFPVRRRESDFAEGPPQRPSRATGRPAPAGGPGRFDRPAAPSARPERPERPFRPRADGPERIVPLRRPSSSARPIPPSRPGQDSRPEIRPRADRPERSDRPQRPGNVGRSFDTPESRPSMRPIPAKSSGPGMRPASRPAFRTSPDGSVPPPARYGNPRQPWAPDRPSARPSARPAVSPRSGPDMRPAPRYRSDPPMRPGADVRPVSRPGADRSFRPGAPERPSLSPRASGPARPRAAERTAPPSRPRKATPPKPSFWQEKTAPTRPRKPKD